LIHSPLVLLIPVKKKEEKKKKGKKRKKAYPVTSRRDSLAFYAHGMVFAFNLEGKEKRGGGGGEEKGRREEV